eukprot:TRINITY_DN33483_c0_g1_i1.p1 TRINITY_DN33483_c0_g1~~TRINITY_DN33483_c0_g1_i1.p1  ORF type:complete len:334 (+),score=47.87 TRINITY_DN33483_c0_g1_i1:46-1002(+)
MSASTSTLHEALVTPEPARQPSAGVQLLRSVSSQLVVAPPVLAPATEEPTRQQSRRVANRAAVQRTVDREAVTRYASIFVFCTLLCIMAGITCYILGIIAVITGLQDWNDPCDVPLGKFAVLSVTTNTFWTRITKRCQTYLFRGSIRRQLTGFVVFLLPQFSLCVAGVVLLVIHHQHLLDGEDTCSPELFNAVRNYIYASCVVAVIGSLMGAAILVAISYVLHTPDFLTNLLGIKKQGCVNAVEKLPKVPFDAETLKDEEDGLMQECTICLMDFDAEMDIVRTPCNHLFHQTCLGNWCKGSLSCPLCREEIGPPDESA